MQRDDLGTVPDGSASDKIRCDACPVMCYIKRGASGACDRYANHDGELVRLDPHVVLERTVSRGGRVVPFQKVADWDGSLVGSDTVFVTAIGAGTTYPDYKPAPFIVSSEIDGVDMVTVVTEGIFSYCGVKVKIDTDRHLGPEAATVRAQGEAVGHVMTSEYGSQMLSLGGVHHLTGGSKAEGRVTCDTLMDLSNGKAVELRDRWRRQRAGAGGQGADGQWRRRGTHAGRLRVGHHRHVRQAMARQGRRRGGGGRSHHRRAVGTSGRQIARRAGDRDQDQGAPLHARPLFPGRAIRAPAGAAPTFPIRCRSSDRSIRSRPGPACAC